MGRSMKTRLNNKGELRAYAQGAWRKAEYRECWYCGKQFPFRMDHKPRPGRNEGRFCSISCANRFRGKLRSVAGRVTFRCIICKAFVRRSRAHAAALITCGRPECVSKRRSQVVTERHKQPGQRQFGVK